MKTCWTTTMSNKGTVAGKGGLTIHISKAGGSLQIRGHLWDLGHNTWRWQHTSDSHALMRWYYKYCIILYIYIYTYTNIHSICFFTQKQERFVQQHVPSAVKVAHDRKADSAGSWIEATSAPLKLQWCSDPTQSVDVGWCWPYGYEYSPSPSLSAYQLPARSIWCWMVLDDGGWCWMVLDGVGWCWMVLDGAGWCWCWMVLDDVGWCWMVLDGAGWCWMVLDGVGWCWMVLDGVGWCWMVLDGAGWC